MVAIRIRVVPALDFYNVELSCTTTKSEEDFKAK